MVMKHGLNINTKFHSVNLGFLKSLVKNITSIYSGKGWHRDEGYGIFKKGGE